MCEGSSEELNIYDALHSNIPCISSSNNQDEDTNTSPLSLTRTQLPTTTANHHHPPSLKSGLSSSCTYTGVYTCIRAQRDESLIYSDVHVTCRLVCALAAAIISTLEVSKPDESCLYKLTSGPPDTHGRVSWSHHWITGGILRLTGGISDADRLVVSLQQFTHRAHHLTTCC